TTPKIVSRRFGVEVNVAQFRICGERSPHTDAAGVFGGAVQPRLISLLTLPRNRVEDPLLLAGLGVVSENVACDVGLGGSEMCRTDDDDIVGNHDGRAVADFPVGI